MFLVEEKQDTKPVATSEVADKEIKTQINGDIGEWSYILIYITLLFLFLIMHENIFDQL